MRSWKVTGEDSTPPPDSFSECLSSRADVALVSSALHSIHSLSTVSFRSRPVLLAAPFQIAFKLRVSNRTGSCKPHSPHSGNMLALLEFCLRTSSPATYSKNKESTILTSVASLPCARHYTKCFIYYVSSNPIIIYGMYVIYNDYPRFIGEMGANLD